MKIQITHFSPLILILELPHLYVYTDCSIKRKDSYEWWIRKDVKEDIVTYCKILTQNLCWLAVKYVSWSTGWNSKGGPTSYKEGVPTTR